MIRGILQALGGLGLFLLGMQLLTQGLRSAADDRLRWLIKRSTRSPLQGVATGCLSTAIVQSSSAITVLAVGFVNASILSFPEALGIIFGANIGTTITGWFVALLGFNLQLDEFAMPLVLLGVIFKIFGRGKCEAAGTAIAGFGLIFVGISTMQLGMAEFRGIVTPEIFPSDTIPGRLLLVLIGVVITVVTQSSSAGVAAALVALHANSISLNQAAAIVIGMNLGTTFTAMLATVGGNVQARRTGFAHVAFNSLTAIGAFFLLTPFLNTVAALWPGAEANSPELVLVGFHTFFNIVGVIAILPFTRTFANLIERMFPERGNLLVKRLDKNQLSTPDAALDAVSATIHDILQVVFHELSRWLRQPASVTDKQLAQDVEDALGQAQRYLQQIPIQAEEQITDHAFLACVHTLDHLRRVNRRLQDQARLRTCRADPELSNMADKLAAACDRIAGEEFPLSPEQAEAFHDINHQLKTDMRTFRVQAVSTAAHGQLTPGEAIKHMDAARWLRRIGYHVWRVAYHMSAQTNEDTLDSRRKRS